MLYDIGRVCMKISGREAGRYCIVLENVDDKFVVIDGDVARKRCNVAHLEPLNIVLNLEKSSSKPEILAMLKKEGLLKERKKSKLAKEKKSTKKERPVKKNASRKK